MEPVHATGIVIGLVKSLWNSLQILEDFASRFASEEIENNLKDAETAISSSRSDLVTIQGNLETTWIQSQSDELLVVLEDAEKRLKILRDNVQNIERLHSKLFLRWQDRVLQRRDIDVAKSLTVLALETVKIIGVAQGRTQRAESLIEASRYTNAVSSYTRKGAELADTCNRSNGRRLMSLTEHLATTRQRSHFPPLLAAADTKAQRIFASMSVPEEQDSFHQWCRAERFTGTCNWFLGTKTFESWREHLKCSGDWGVLWCQGKSGIGKTMLASKIIETLRTSHLVAYFYMGSGGGPYSATNVVASLLRQLCLSYHIVPRRLEQLYKRSDRESHIQLELDDILDAMREASRDIRQPVIIVMDGLDECNVREPKDFAKVFTGLEGTPWKFVVTSRSTQDILSKAKEGCSQFLITEDSVENDIRSFVDNALRWNEPVDNMLGDQVFRLEVIEILTYRAHGMFYWASLQLRRILNQTTIAGIKKVLVDIPSEVGGIVKCALGMINAQGPTRAQLAYRTLAVLTAAKSPPADVAPMTARAVSYAIGISHVLDSKRRLSTLSEDEIPNVASIIECCIALVTVNPVTKSMTLAHFDIEQYMRTHWQDLFSWKDKLMLANITVAYLSMDAFSFGPCRQANEFIGRLEKYPFLDFASCHWGHHAREAMLLQDADAEQGKNDLTENVSLLLDDRMQLDSSLQVCDLNSRPSEFRKVLLLSNEKDFALHADKYSSVSKLQLATRYGLSAIARKIIENHPGMVSDQDDFGRSALHEAAQAGWEDLADILLQAGAPPLLKDKKEKTPLYYAALNGNTEIISLISVAIQNEILPQPSGSAELSSGRNGTVPMSKDQGDPSALKEAFCDAAEAGKLGVIISLLKYHVNLADSKKRGKSALMFAIHGEHEKIIEVLLDAGATLSCPDLSPSEQIPLHQAIRCSNENMVTILLDRGADFDTRDEFSRTALFETLNCHSLDGAILLLDQGIDLSSCDNKGNTILHEAICRSAFEHASLFIGQGIELNKFNGQGLTPLHLAARHNNCRIVDELLKKGADVDIIDRQDGWTPLMYAVSNGSTQLCHILLAYGANVAKVSSDKKTPLMIAANAGHYDLAKILLESGADVNDQSTGSPTPLLLAAAAGHTHLVQLLLEHGADANALDHRSNSALNLAEAADHLSAVRALFGDWP